ncbi:DASH complex subunit DAD2 [Streptomyces sp. 7R007]
MAPKSQPTAEQLEQLRDQLRAEIREGRETLKDLHAAIKEARALAPQLVGAMLTEEVSKQLEVLSERTEKAMDHSVARVIAKFDELFRVITGQDHASRRAGKPSIPELIEDHARNEVIVHVRPDPSHVAAAIRDVRRYGPGR